VEEETAATAIVKVKEAATAVVKVEETAIIKAEEESTANRAEEEAAGCCCQRIKCRYIRHHQNYPPTSSDWEWMRNGRPSTTKSIYPSSKGKKRVE
jgi:hypothetical protein